MRRTYREGEAKLPGFLEDYSFVADGLLALYESTFDQHWLDKAIALADGMIDLFWDEDAGALRHRRRSRRTGGTASGRLRQRPACGSSVASDLLLRLAVITGNEDYNRKAVPPLRPLANS